MAVHSRGGLTHTVTEFWTGRHFSEVFATCSAAQCGMGLEVDSDGTPSTQASSPARLLIAEDHALIREGLRAMLSCEANLQVVGEAQNGREAVEMCCLLSPDLILMDVRMPEMDGLQATRIIKEKQPSVSVLIVTTYQDPDYLLEAVRAGAAGYVLKEAPRYQLLAAVRGTLSGEPVLNEHLAMKLLLRLSREVESESVLGQHEVRESFGQIPETLTRRLSSREIETLRLIASGKTNRQIAHELMVSLSTVKTYVQRIIKKLGVTDRTQASVKALDLGLLSDR